MARRPVKAERIADAMAQRIAAGEFGTRGWLPPLRELAMVYDVVERTAASGVALLVARGLVETVSGKGTRVMAPVTHRDADDIARQTRVWRGFHATDAWVSAEAYTDTYRLADVAVPPDVAGRLGVPLDSTVMEHVQVQGLVMEGTRRPVQLTTTWVVVDVVTQPPVLHEHSTRHGRAGAWMIAAGYNLGYEDVVTARMPTDPERAQLALPEGQPVLVVWHRVFDQGGTGRTLEVTARVIHPGLRQLVYRCV